MIERDATQALIEVKTEHEFANIRIGDNILASGVDKGVLDCPDLTQKRILVPVVVTAADGTTVKTYNIVLIRDVGAYITGKIITENTKGKYNATVTLYKTSDLREIGDELNPREEIAKVKTNEDGTFKILAYMPDAEGSNILDDNQNGIPDALEETYDIVVTKDGYLDYHITEIEIAEEKQMPVGEHKIIAGDVVKTGEIEIDDLVAINKMYGKHVVWEEQETLDVNQKYDFNEDGVIDTLDRNILSANYGIGITKVKWVNPEKQEKFILPIDKGYVITSDYGLRIDPITKEEKKHTGIDISGTHHEEVKAVAEGEITYAGVKEGFGNCVEIKHIIDGEIIYSFYAHLSRIDVLLGEKVKQGDSIGLEGGEPGVDENIGNSTGHHLHFEIRNASGYGNDVDPKDYIEF